MRDERKPIMAYCCDSAINWLLGSKGTIDISIVTGLAVDKGKNEKYKLTVETINDTELNKKTAGGNSPSVLYALEGNTVDELVQKMNIGLTRNLIYSHMRVLVISKDIASSGMMEFIDSFERGRDPPGRLRHSSSKRRQSCRHITGALYRSEIFFFKIDVAVGKWHPSYGDLLQQ